MVQIENKSEAKENVQSSAELFGSKKGKRRGNRKDKLLSEEKNQNQPFRTELDRGNFK